MPIKELADFQVFVWPHDGLPRFRVEPFYACESIAQLLVPHTGDGVLTIIPTPQGFKAVQDATASWANQPNFVSITPLMRFLRLSAFDDSEKEGASAAVKVQRSVRRGKVWGEIAGFALMPIPIPRNFRLTTFNAERDPSGTPAFDFGLARPFAPLIWKPVRGVPRSAVDASGNPLAGKATDLRGKYAEVPTFWDTVVEDSYPLRSRVFHARHVPDDTVVVQTEDDWEENLAFYLDLTELQVAQGQKGQARIRVEFGGVWSIVIRDGQPATFEKRRTQVTSTAPQWIPLASFSRGGRVNLANATKLYLSVERISGRFHLELRQGDAAPTICDVIDRVSVRHPDGSKSMEPRPARWASAPLKVTFAGVEAHLGGGELLYLNLGTTLSRTGDVVAEGEPALGLFERRVSAPGRIEDGVTGPANVVCHAYPGGWARDGTQMTVVPRVVMLPVGQGLFERGIEYAGELRASDDARDTPFLSLVQLSIEADTEQPDFMPLDITPACVGRAQLSSGQPPDVQVSQLTLQIGRAELEELELPADATSFIGASASVYDYVAPNHRVQLQARWNYDDETQDEFATLFDGSIYSPSGSNGKLLDWAGTLTCRDNSQRLKAPWAKIGAKYKAADFLFARKVNEGTGSTLYGAEIIYNGLLTLFGPDVAAALNGGIGTNGEGLLRFFPRGHYPLMGSANDVAGWFPVGAKFTNSLPMQGRLVFPPPFRQDVLTWFEQIAKLDRAVFLWMILPGMSNPRPVPVYGRITEIVRRARELGDIEVRDCVYENDRTKTANTPLVRVETRYLPDRAFTQVQTYAGQVPGGDGLLPALAAGEASFPPGPDYDPQDGGERTLVLESDLFLAAGAAGANSADAQDAVRRFLRVVARATLDQFKGVKQEELLLTTRGDVSYTWGRSLMPWMRANGGAIGSETPGEAQGLNGDYSDAGLALHGKRFAIKRVDQTLDFNSGAWEMSLCCRPVSATGL